MNRSTPARGRCILSAFTCFVSFWFWAGGQSSPVWAQLSPAEREHLISLAREARDAVGTRPFPSAEKAGQQFLQAVEGVSEYMGRRTSRQNLDDWLAYIEPDPVVEAIREGRFDNRTAAEARQLRERLIGDVAGFELTPIVRLRRRAEQLVAAHRFTSPDTSERLVQQQLDALIRRLEQADSIPSADDAAAIAAIIGMLDESNQTPQLVSAAQAAFAQPNVVISVHGGVVERAVRRDVHEPRPVRDCILGTTVIGHAVMRGDVVGRLAPSHGRVQVDLVLTGQISSNTVGYNGPVRLPAVGNGRVTASRSMWIDETGIALSPTTAAADMQSTITSIQHPLKIVRRIAARRVAQSKPQADAIATQRLRDRVGNDFNRQTSEAVAQGGQFGGPVAAAAPDEADPLFKTSDPLGRVRNLLRRLDISEPKRTVGSTRELVYLHAVQRGDQQLAAVNPPPSLPALLRQAPPEPRVAANVPPTPLALVSTLVEGLRYNGPFHSAAQVHESAIENVASRLLAGRTVTGEELDELLAAGRPAADGDAADTDTEEPQEPFEIDFSAFRPVVVDFRDQTLRIGIRGTRFSQGERELVRAMQIAANYHPDRLDDGTMIFRREGDVSVDFPGTGRLTVQQVALRRAIQRTFNERFPETLLDRSLPAMPRLAFLELGLLKVNMIDLRDGWLSIAVR